MKSVLIQNYVSRKNPLVNFMKYSSLFVVPLLVLPFLGIGCSFNTEGTADTEAFADTLVREALRDAVVSSTPYATNRIYTTTTEDGGTERRGTIDQILDSVTSADDVSLEFMNNVGLYPAGDVTISITGDKSKSNPSTTVVFQTDDAPSAVQEWYIPQLEQRLWKKTSQFNVGSINTLNFERDGEKLIVTMMKMGGDGKTNVTVIYTTVPSAE